MALRVSARFGSARLHRVGFVAGCLLTAVLLPSVAAATPTQGDAASDRASRTASAPTIQSVQEQLSSLRMKSDQLVEKYNQADIRYRQARHEAAVAARAAKLAAHKLAVARTQYSNSVVAQYEGGSYSATGALLSSDSGSGYLDQLDTLSMYSQHNAQIVSSFTATQKLAVVTKQQAAGALTRATAARTTLATQKQQTTKQIASYQALLDQLNARQRALWLRRQSASGTSVDTQAKLASIAPALKQVHITSAALEKVIAFAIKQVGKPYVWGSGGPSSYDCSGLTMASYAQAGVALPHSAAGQYGYGHHIAFDQLQPGDLLFFYQPIGHVAMYIGDGMMVSAPQTGENVKIIPADSESSDYTGATRLIG